MFGEVKRCLVFAWYLAPSDAKDQSLGCWFQVRWDLQTIHQRLWNKEHRVILTFIEQTAELRKRGEQSGLNGWAQTNRGASVWFQNSRLKFCQLRFDPSGSGGVPNMETILGWGKLKGIRSAMPQWSQPGRSQIHPNPLTFWDQKSPIPIIPLAEWRHLLPNTVHFPRRAEGELGEEGVPQLQLGDAGGLRTFPGGCGGHGTKHPIWGHEYDEKLEAESWGRYVKLCKYRTTREELFYPLGKSQHKYRLIN